MNLKTTLILNLCLVASVGFCQSTEEIREANKYLLQNLECGEILIKQDKIIDACDSAKQILKVKLNQSESVNLIHKSIEAGQSKIIESTQSDLTKIVKKRNRWRRWGVIAIGENLFIGLGIYLTFKP